MRNVVCRSREVCGEVDGPSWTSSAQLTRRESTRSERDVDCVWFTNWRNLRRRRGGGRRPDKKRGRDKWGWGKKRDKSKEGGTEGWYQHQQVMGQYASMSTGVSGIPKHCLVQKFVNWRLRNKLGFCIEEEISLPIL